jgi:rod shape determining protein RodA
MMIDRRLLAHFDWTLCGLVCLIASAGILNLYSVTADMDFAGNPFYVRQITWFAVSLAMMLGVALIEYRSYIDFAYPIYGFLLVALIAVMAYGYITSGAQRWVRFGSISFQPSEFMKIALILVLAKSFQAPPRDRAGYSLKQLGFPFLLLALPVLLILKQPDLGTAIILTLIFFSVLTFVKIRWKILAGLSLAAAGLAPLLWSLLKDYQKRRVITFFNPDLDPLGAGYQIIQSKIAVGSGGVVGKGFMKGTQCKLGFLPEQQTDFIFSALAEEWGLLGSLFVIGLYFALIVWGLRIAVQSKDRLGALIAFGVTAMLFWHTFINIGMVLGMMPVVGIPLPLLSYGGSFLLSTMIGIGLLLNVSMRRYLF